jgi:hypothetical protein
MERDMVARSVPVCIFNHWYLYPHRISGVLKISQQRILVDRDEKLRPNDSAKLIELLT